MGNNDFPVELRPVLTVKELPPSYRNLRNHFDSLRERASDTPQAHEQEILDYLQQGIVFEVCLDPGLLYDVLQPGVRIGNLICSLPSGDSDVPASGHATIQPNALLTDGSWVWAAAWIYYVHQYHVRLDSDFVEPGIARNWTFPNAPIPLEKLNSVRFFSG